MNSQNKRKEVGVFCGTFNPIHLGHLLIAECARDQFELDNVLFITSPRPPHRRTDLLEGEDRHELVSAAVAENPHFQASRIELDRRGPSYTSETVRALLQSYDEPVRINLILGADNITQLEQWHDYEYLIKTCRFLVAPRLVDLTQARQKQPAPGHSQASDSALNSSGANAKQQAPDHDRDHDHENGLAAADIDVHLDLLKDLQFPDAQICAIIFPYVAISSSAIRQRLREGRSVLYMVPKAVNDLLRSKNFYGCKDSKPG